MTERQSKHVSLQIDAQAAPKALMRQEEQDTLGSDRADNDPIDATDTLWARLFGTGASIPDLTAVPDETEIGLVGSNASSLANTSEGTSVAASDDSSIADLTLVSAESQIAHQFHQFGSAASPGSNASNAANTSSVPSSAPSSEAMEAMSVAPIVPILRIDSELIKTNGSGNYTGPKIPSFKDCRDVWVPEWSSEDPEENCKKWARNSEWGALSTASSLKGACKVEWAQSNCMATCGCEDVRRAWLDRAILQIVEGMGLSRQQMEEVESTLEGISSSGKEAVLHVVWAAAGALNMDKAKASPAAAGKADASGEAAETGDATDEGSAEESTTISPAAASDIIRMSAALGLDTEQAKQLNATVQLIDPEHYDDVLDVLTAIHKSASTTTTSTAVSDEEIEQAAYGLGIKEEDIAQIHATLSNIKPELNHEILHTVEDLKASTKQIGVERTGKAIVKHLQNLSKPSTNHLPHEVEPNNFVISVASADARELYRETQGHDPQGFYLKVSLPVEKVVSFIEKKAGVSVEPRRLSLAIARLEFSWPSSSCSNDESGFTDFKLLDFHAGQMSNEGSSCGSLVATSIDQNGELRLPSKGSQDLFLLAGMFGSKYSDSYEGAQVNLKISQLVFHEIREGGDVVEYSICGRGSLTWKDQHFYLGCPDENPLTIAHPEGSLGDSVKLCGGGVPAEDDAIQSNCFAVPESSEM